MKALGLVVSDKKIFENCILKTYFLTPWPTYATNQNHLNNFGRGPPRDHSCEVWSKSNEWFQRRRCLSKKVYGRRTTDDGRQMTTDDGQRSVTIAHPEHFVLRWAKKLSITLSVTPLTKLLLNLPQKGDNSDCHWTASVIAGVYLLPPLKTQNRKWVRMIVHKSMAHTINAVLCTFADVFFCCLYSTALWPCFKPYELRK